MVCFANSIGAFLIEKTVEKGPQAAMCTPLTKNTGIPQGSILELPLFIHKLLLLVVLLFHETLLFLFWSCCSTIWALLLPVAS